MLDREQEIGKWNYAVALNSPDREQAERGSLILHRLVPAPDHGRGFRRDPETGFVCYSSEWLSDAVHCFRCGHEADEHDPPPPDDPSAYGACAACEGCDEYLGVPKAPE